MDRSATELTRVDTYRVPLGATDEFLASVMHVHDLFAGMEGCVVNRVLRRCDTGGDWTYATVVGWRDRTALEAARASVKAMHATAGFDSAEMLDRLRIVADTAECEVIAI